MAAPTVLVAFASQSGATAGIADAIAAELRAAGIATDCRAASSVAALDAYDALVLGSGVFVRSRASDGGGFLERNRPFVDAHPVWLFCSGPIGPGQAPDADRERSASTVIDVGAAVGARGAAAFGTLGAETADPFGPPLDLRAVRAWARGIAAALADAHLAAAS